MPGLDLFGHQMRDNFGIGFAFKRAPTRGQLIAQRLEILDNAIVDQRHFAGRMRVGVARRRRAVGGPAGVGDTDIARRIVGFQHLHQIGQLPLGAAADQLAILHGADARAVIAAIFHPLQPVDQPVGDCFFAYNTNNAAHGFLSFWLAMYRERGCPASLPENPLYFV